MADRGLANDLDEVYSDVFNWFEGVSQKERARFVSMLIYDFGICTKDADSHALYDAIRDHYDLSDDGSDKADWALGRGQNGGE